MEPASPKQSKSANITLIGMAGAGKTVIGKELAEKLGYVFLDIDDMIEKKAKKRLQKLLDDLGDDGFLDLEKKTVLGIGTVKGHIFSPGGSVVYSPEAMSFLKEHSIIVFLNNPYGSIKDRLTNKHTRGIVGLKKKNLRELYDERLILYRKYADIEIEASERFDIEMMARKIIEAVFGDHAKDTFRQCAD